MKQITKTYNVFNYEELNKEAQNKAMEKAYEWLAEEKCEYLKDDLLNEMDFKYNIIPDELFYSLSYCQGDGLCFTLKNIFSYTRLKDVLLTDLNVFEKAVISGLDKQKRDLILEYLNCDYNISIRKISWNYEHSHTCDFEWEHYEDDDSAKEKAINDAIEEICSHTGLLRDVYDKVCSYLEELGYKIAYPEEDEVIEYINDQGFKYLEDGSIFSE